MPYLSSMFYNNIIVEICLELVLGKCPTSDNIKKYAKTLPYK